MSFKTVFSLLVAVTLAGLAGAAAAQDVTAEVRTWGGQSWLIAQPSLEVFYTIVSKAQEGSQGGGARVGEVGGMVQLGLGLLGRQTIDPSLMTMSRLFGSQAPDAIQGHREATEITLYRDGVATEIPVARIATLTFTRQPVQDSPLPPYMADSHIRSSATAVLADGTRVEADYVNLGTLIVRGMTPAGRVDIPWQNIQTVEFRR